MELGIENHKFLCKILENSLFEVNLRLNFVAYIILSQSDLMLRAVRAPRADSWSPHEDRFGFLVEFYPILM